MQITFLKFGGNWILHPGILKFEFYPWRLGLFGFYTLTFQNLDFDSYIFWVFRFYPLKFESIWILHPKIS